MIILYVIAVVLCVIGISIYFIIKRSTPLQCSISSSGTLNGSPIQISSLYTANATGGSGTYTYLWSITGTVCTLSSTTQKTCQCTLQSNVGNYYPPTVLTCTVTDTKQSVTSSVIIRWISPLLVSYTKNGNVTGTYNQTSSTYIVDVSGGIPPYTYNWVDLSGSIPTFYPIENTCYCTLSGCTGTPLQSIIQCMVTDTSGQSVQTPTMLIDWNFIHLENQSTGSFIGTNTQTSPVYTITANGGSGTYTYTYTSTGTPCTISTTHYSSSIALQCTGHDLSGVINPTHVNVHVSDTIDTAFSNSIPITIPWNNYILLSITSSGDVSGGDTQTSPLYTVSVTGGSGSYSYLWTDSPHNYTHATPIYATLPSTAFTSNMILGIQPESVVSITVKDTMTSVTTSMTQHITWNPYISLRFEVVGQTQGLTKNQISPHYTISPVGGSDQYRVTWTYLSGTIVSDYDIPIVTDRLKIYVPSGLTGTLASTTMKVTVADTQITLVNSHEFTISWNPYVTLVIDTSGTTTGTSTQVSPYYISSAINGSGNYIYSWNILDIYAYPQLIYSTPESVTYQFIGQNIQGTLPITSTMATCTILDTVTKATDSKTILIPWLLYITTVMSPNSNVIQGTTTQISPTYFINSTGGSGHYTYSFSYEGYPVTLPPSTTSNPCNVSFTATGFPTTTTIVCNVSDRDVSGLIATTRHVITWNRYLTATITSNGSTRGSTFQTSPSYTCNVLGGSGSYRYQWSFLNVDANQAFIDSSSNTIQCTYKNTSGITTTSYIGCAVYDTSLYIPFTTNPLTVNTSYTTVTWNPYIITSPITYSSIFTGTSTQFSPIYTVDVSGGSGKYTYEWNWPSSLQLGLVNGTIESKTIQFELSNITGELPQITTPLTCTVKDTESLIQFTNLYPQLHNVLTYMIQWPLYISGTISGTIPTIDSSYNQIETCTCHVRGGYGMYMYNWSVSSVDLIPPSYLDHSGTRLTNTYTNQTVSIDSSGSICKVYGTTSGSNTSNMIVQCIVSDISGTVIPCTLTKTINWLPFIKGYFTIGQVQSSDNMKTQYVNITCTGTGGRGNYKFSWIISDPNVSITISPNTDYTVSSSNAVITYQAKVGQNYPTSVHCGILDMDYTTNTIVGSISWKPYYLPLHATGTVQGKSTGLSTQVSGKCICGITGGSGNVTYTWSNVNGTPVTRIDGNGSTIVYNSNGVYYSESQWQGINFTNQMPNTIIQCVVTDTVTYEVQTVTMILTWNPNYPPITIPTIQKIGTSLPTIQNAQVTASTQLSPTLVCNPTGGSGTYTFSWLCVNDLSCNVYTITNTSTTSTIQFIKTNITGAATTDSILCTVTDANQTNLTQIATCSITWLNNYNPLVTSITQNGSIYIGTPSSTQNSAQYTCNVVSGGSGSYRYAWTIASSTISSVTLDSSNNKNVVCTVTDMNSVSQNTVLSCVITDTDDSSLQSTQTVSIQWIPISYLMITESIPFYINNASSSQGVTLIAQVTGGSNQLSNYTYTWSVDNTSMIIPEIITTLQPYMVNINAHISGFGLTTSTIKCQVYDSVTHITTKTSYTITWLPLLNLSIQSSGQSSLSSNPELSQTYQCVVFGGSNNYSYVWKISPSNTNDTNNYQFYNCTNTSNPVQISSTVNGTSSPSTTVNLSCSVTDLSNSLSVLLKTPLFINQNVTFLPWTSNILYASLQSSGITDVSGTKNQSITYIIDVSGGSGQYIVNWSTTDGKPYSPSFSPGQLYFTQPTMSTVFSVWLPINTDSLQSISSVKCVITDQVYTTLSPVTLNTTTQWNYNCNPLSLTINSDSSQLPTGSTQTSSNYLCHLTGGTGSFIYKWSMVSINGLNVPNSSVTRNGPFIATASSCTYGSDTSGSIMKLNVTDYNGLESTVVLQCTVSDRYATYLSPITQQVTITWLSYFTPLNAWISSSSNTFTTYTTQPFQCIASGGSGSYSYKWNNPNPSVTISPNDQNSNVTFTLTNTNMNQLVSYTTGCIVTDLISNKIYETIHVNIVWNIISTNLISTISRTDTQINSYLSSTSTTPQFSCSIINGSTPYTYNWTVDTNYSSINGVSNYNTVTIKNNGSSSYTPQSTYVSCTVTDSLGNSISGTYNFTWVFPLTIHYSNPTPNQDASGNILSWNMPITCYGGSSSYNIGVTSYGFPISINSTQTNNPTIYNYTFTAINPNNIISNSSSSSISFSVTDQLYSQIIPTFYSPNNLTMYWIYTIPFSVKIKKSSLIQDPQHSGNQTMTLYADVSGGISPYTYSWSNYLTQPSPPNYSTYTITTTATDISQCSFTIENWQYDPQGQDDNVLSVTITVRDSNNNQISSINSKFPWNINVLPPTVSSTHPVNYIKPTTEYQTISSIGALDNYLSCNGPYYTSLYNYTWTNTDTSGLEFTNPTLNNTGVNYYGYDISSSSLTCSVCLSGHTNVCATSQPYIISNWLSSPYTSTPFISTTSTPYQSATNTPISITTRTNVSQTSPLLYVIFNNGNPITSVYQWSNTDGLNLSFSSPNSSSTTITYNGFTDVSSTIICTVCNVTYPSECITTITKTIQWLSAPYLTVIYNPNSSTISSSVQSVPATITSVTGGSGNYSYAWSSTDTNVLFTSTTASTTTITYNQNVSATSTINCLVTDMNLSTLSTTITFPIVWTAPTSTTFNINYNGNIVTDTAINNIDTSLTIDPTTTLLNMAFTCTSNSSDSYTYTWSFVSGSDNSLTYCKWNTYSCTLSNNTVVYSTTNNSYTIARLCNETSQTCNLLLFTYYTRVKIQCIVTNSNNTTVSTLTTGYITTSTNSSGLISGGRGPPGGSPPPPYPKLYITTTCPT